MTDIFGNFRNLAYCGVTPQICIFMYSPFDPLPSKVFGDTGVCFFVYYTIHHRKSINTISNISYYSGIKIVRVVVGRGGENLPVISPTKKPAKTDLSPPDCRGKSKCTISMPLKRELLLILPIDFLWSNEYYIKKQTFYQRKPLLGSRPNGL